MSDLETLRAKIRAFRNTDVCLLKDDQIEAALDEFYHVFHVNVANLGGCSVFRVRRIEDGSCHDRVEDFGAPPLSAVKRQGRANRVGEPVFYGALDPLTAIAEVRIQPGERYSLAEFELSGRSPYDFGSVVIQESVRAGGKIGADSSSDELRDLGEELSRFMVEEFTRDVPEGSEHLYKRSCAIARYLLRLPNKDSILYPSLQRADAVNLAMPAAESAKRLRFRQVVTCQMATGGTHEATALRRTSKQGALGCCEAPFSLPCPLKVSGEWPRFSTLLDPAKIPSPDEMVRRLLDASRLRQGL